MEVVPESSYRLLKERGVEMIETRVGRMRRLRFEAGVREIERVFAELEAEAETKPAEAPRQPQSEPEASASDE